MEINNDDINDLSDMSSFCLNNDKIKNKQNQNFKNFDLEFSPLNLNEEMIDITNLNNKMKNKKTDNKFNLHNNLDDLEFSPLNLNEEMVYNTNLNHKMKNKKTDNKFNLHNNLDDLEFSPLNLNEEMINNTNLNHKMKNKKTDNKFNLHNNLDDLEFSPLNLNEEMINTKFNPTNTKIENKFNKFDDLDLEFSPLNINEDSNNDNTYQNSKNKNKNKFNNPIQEENLIYHNYNFSRIKYIQDKFLQKEYIFQLKQHRIELIISPIDKIIKVLECDLLKEILINEIIEDFRYLDKRLNLQKSFLEQIDDIRQEEAIIIRTKPKGIIASRNIWENGQIYYKIGIFKTNRLLISVKGAIEEWNNKNSPHCKFLEVLDSDFYVTFEESSKGNPKSHIGPNKKGKILLTNYYDDMFTEVKKPDILHQMMHCAGFKHNQCQDEFDDNCNMDEFDFINYEINERENFSIGNYENKSILHFREELELDQNGSKISTFSQSDISAIKILYNSENIIPHNYNHHGIIHKFLICVIKQNCEYQGKSDHWSCCLKNSTEKICVDHSGIWHKNQNQNNINNNLKNKLSLCGNGCSYLNNKLHWSCCNSEFFYSICESKNTKSYIQTNINFIKISNVNLNHQKENLQDEGDPNEIKNIKTLKGHVGIVSCLIQLKDGKLATGSFDNTIRIWDNENNFNSIFTLNDHKGWVNCLLQLDDGILISGSQDKKIRVWDPQDEYSCMYILNDHQNAINNLIKLNNGNFASSSYDHTIRIWSPDQLFRCVEILTGHTKTVKCILPLIYPENILVSGSDDHSIKIWKFQNNKFSCIQTKIAYEDQINNNLEGRNIKQLLGHTQPITFLYQLLDGNLASTSKDRMIKIWNTLDDFKLIISLSNQQNHITSLLQLDNGFLACASENNIRIFNYIYDDNLYILRGHSSPISILIKLKSGRLASCGKFNDNSIVIWENNTYEVLSHLKGHTNSVICMLQMKDGRIATGSEDKTIKIWGVK